MADKPIAHELTIVIPTLGRETLRKSIQSLTEGSMLPARIVLAHQGVQGSMSAMLRDFEALPVPIGYLHSDKRGCAAGRNTGIAAVATRFFATTDDDCTVDVNWIAELSAALNARPNEIVTGCVLASEEGAPSTVVDERQRVFTKAPLKGDHFTGGNFGVALSIFKSVGDFDESPLVRYCEDNEWSFRALAQGHPIRFVPDIVITHLHWRDDTDMNLVYERYARSQGGWYGRKLKEGDMSFILRIGYEVMRGAKRWAVGSATHDTLRKINGRAFVVDLLRGVATGWNER